VLEQQGLLAARFPNSLESELQFQKQAVLGLLLSLALKKPG